MKDFKQFQAQNRLQTFNEEGNLSGEHILKEAIDFAIFLHLQIAFGSGAGLRFVKTILKRALGWRDLHPLLRRRCGCPGEAQLAVFKHLQTVNGVPPWGPSLK